jgi:hypothetical protein
MNVQISKRSQSLEKAFFLGLAAVRRARVSDEYGPFTAVMATERRGSFPTG